MDEYTIREFLARDYPRVVAGTALMCGNRAAAEDAVQEALVRAWERWERGERIDRLDAWVAVVATNLLRSRFRRLRVERRGRQVLAERAAAGSPSPDATEERIATLHALASLPRRQREATVLRYYLDLDVAEVARALGVTEGTAKTTLHRARRALVLSIGEAEEHIEEANHRAEP